MPIFQGLPEIAPPADFRVVGQKIPRQPARYSGRTAMWAHRNVHEPQPPEDPDSRSRLLDGRLSRAAAGRSDPAFLGSWLEFGAGAQ